MKLLLLFLSALLITINVFSQNLTIYEESTQGACDGYAILDPSSINSAENYTWLTTTQDSIVTGSLLSNSDTLFNLCSGYYALQYHDSLFPISNIDTLYYYFTVNPVNICSNFAVSATGVNETSAGTCDGSAAAAVTGANGAVTYLWSNSSSTASINGLCVGNYTVTATDTASCTANFTVNIASDSTCSNFTVSATGVNETSAGTCDGSAAAAVTGANGAVTYLWSNSSTTASINGLCVGNYTVTATDSASCTAVYTVYVDTDSTATSPLQLIISTNNESLAGACDGVVDITVTGGVQPYTYAYSFGGTNTSTISTVCTGYHTIVVYDAFGDSISGLFIITSPTTTYDTYNYSDSTVTDTVFTAPIETCLIDFAYIDTAYISNTVFLGSDSLQLTWTVIDSSGMQLITTDYFISGLSSGVYTFSLSLFCGNKAIDNVFTLIDSYYVEPTSLGVDEFTEESITAYPNPFMDKLTLQVPSSMVGDQLKVIDIYGRVFLEKTIKFTKQTLQLSELANGPYFIVTDQYSIKVQKN